MRGYLFLKHNEVDLLKIERAKSGKMWYMVFNVHKVIVGWNSTLKYLALFPVWVLT